MHLGLWSCLWFYLCLWHRLWLWQRLWCVMPRSPDFGYVLTTAAAASACYFCWHDIRQVTRVNSAAAAACYCCCYRASWCDLSCGCCCCCFRTRLWCQEFRDSCDLLTCEFCDFLIFCLWCSVGDSCDFLRLRLSCGEGGGDGGGGGGSRGGLGMFQLDFLIWATKATRNLISTDA